MGFLEKAYAIEDRIAEWFSRKFSGKYLRVLLYAQKPDSEELSHLTRVSLLGLVFVGAVGFFMYLLFYYAFHINL